jgi:hypothetical protein
MMGNRNLPSAVRDLFLGDRLDRAERDFEAVLGAGASGAPLSSSPKLREARRLLDELLSSARTPTEAVRVGVELLRSMTSFGAVNDPTREGSELLWLRLVEHFLPHDLEGARAVAREWSRCLFDLGFDSDEEVMNRVLAHNVVGVIEALAGNDARAEHFLELAQVGSELEPANGTSTFLRACRFVRTALRARG